MNIFKWFPFFKSKKEDNSTLEKVNSEYQKALNRNEFRIRKIPHYESPHDEIERVRRKNSIVIDDIITAGIASTIFNDSPSESEPYISGIDSYNSDNHSHSSGFDGGFGGGDYSGGGSSGGWDSSSDSSSSDSGSSDYSSND